MPTNAYKNHHIANTLLYSILFFITLKQNYIHLALVSPPIMVPNSSPSDLTLESKPQSCSMLLKSFACDRPQAHKLEEYLSLLEQERLKIDAFKRELPLCMQLLTNAMEVSKHQLQSFKATNTNQEKRPILEEFIPIKHTSFESSSDHPKAPNATSDKANWMTSAQLWSQTPEETTREPAPLSTSQESEMGAHKERDTTRGGAFLPFTKERSSNPMGHELALAPNEGEGEEIKDMKNEGLVASENSVKVANGNGTDGAHTSAVGGANTSQTNRKQRRCWSPDLHRRFVNALQMLGGSQVATPKQIRELMKVDGLTNDEVKSHLQKYRLHTRRPGPSPPQPGAPGPQLVVLGGIWMPPEYATSAAAHHHHMVQQSTIYNAHPTAQVGPHYCPPALPQAEFYPPPLPQALGHHPNHHQLHIYKAASQHRQGPNPEPDGARDRSESIDNEKSGSISWKGDSGEESNEDIKRKRLASMREGEEESNGSEITLKF